MNTTWKWTRENQIAFIIVLLYYKKQTNLAQTKMMVH